MPKSLKWRNIMIIERIKRKIEPQPSNFSDVNIGDLL